MTRESEEESAGIDQFLFPKATIRKIVKPVLQEKRIQPKSLELINESAVLFLSYLTTLATAKTKIKTLKEDDVKRCIEDIGFKAWLEDIDELMYARIEEEANKPSKKKDKVEMVDSDNDEADPEEENVQEDPEPSVNTVLVKDMEDL